MQKDFVIGRKKPFPSSPCDVSCWRASTSWACRGGWHLGFGGGRDVFESTLNCKLASSESLVQIRSSCRSFYLVCRSCLLFASSGTYISPFLGSLSTNKATDKLWDEGHTQGIKPRRSFAAGCSCFQRRAARDHGDLPEMLREGRVGACLGFLYTVLRCWVMLLHYINYINTA